MTDTGPSLPLLAAPGWALAAGGVALLALLVLLFRFRLAALRRGLAGAVPAQTNVPEGRYDAFISYKSENVAFARAIADRLIASGLRVWFAEYQILLSGRDRFQEAIDRGIDRSSYGIAITNDRYAGSEHCRREMARLLGRCGPDRMFEIRLPAEPATRQTFPGLRTACTIDSTGDVEAALAVIGDGLGWRIARGVAAIQTAERRLHRGSCAGSDYSVDVTGWELVEEAFQGGGPCYGLREHGLLWNLQCGEEYDPRIYDARRRWTEHSRDDRRYYELMCDYADSYLQSSGEQVGAHLFFLEDTTHLAVSYRAGPHWKRRYSIMLVEPHSYKIAEFLFTFQFEGDFAEYCRLAPIMDALVASLRWGARDAGVPTPVATPSQAADRVERVLDDVAPANKLLDEGMALMKAGELARGLATLERVLDYTNSGAMQGAVHFNIGLAHEKGGNWDAAVRSYRAALAANPIQPNALCNLGAIHHRRGDLGSALNCFLKAAEIDPADRIAANNIVICYQDLGETERARESLARWRGLQP